MPLGCPETRHTDVANGRCDEAHVGEDVLTIGYRGWERLEMTNRNLSAGSSETSFVAMIMLAIEHGKPATLRPRGVDAGGFGAIPGRLRLPRVRNSEMRDFSPSLAVALRISAESA